MKLMNTSRLLSSLSLLTLLSLSSCITPMPGDPGYNSGPAYGNGPAYSNRPGYGNRPAYGSGHRGDRYDRDDRRNPNYRPPIPPAHGPSHGRPPVHGNTPSLRPLANGGVQATMPGGCYVICDRNGRVIKENACSKADLVIATRAARDYLSSRRGR